MFLQVPHINLTHLRRTYCPAHVSVAKLAASGYTITYLTMFIGFSPRGVSHAAFCFWFGIIYALSAGGERAISPPQHSISRRDVSWLAAAQQFGIHLLQRKTRQNVKRSAERHTSKRRRQRVRLGGAAGNHLGEVSAGQRLRYIREQMNGD